MKEFIKFREAKSEDFNKIHKWLNEEHVQEFFQPRNMTLEQVIAKYQPRLEKRHPIKMHLALLNSDAFGFLQSYRVLDYEEFSKDIQESHGFTIDFYIGETQYLRKGLGSQMIDSYISYVSKKEFPEERVCFICHRKDNPKAIHASKHAGLKEVRRVIEEGYPSILLRKEVRRANENAENVRTDSA